jgi:hypothetical protein
MAEGAAQDVAGGIEIGGHHDLMAGRSWGRKAVGAPASLSFGQPYGGLACLRLRGPRGPR